VTDVTLHSLVDVCCARRKKTWRFCWSTVKLWFWHGKEFIWRRQKWWLQSTSNCSSLWQLWKCVDILLSFVSTFVATISYLTESVVVYINVVLTHFCYYYCGMWMYAI